MRVLWLCNVMLPIIGEYLKQPFSNGGGWLTGLSQDILQSNDVNLELAVCFPMKFETSIIQGTITKDKNKKSLQYFGFPISSNSKLSYDKEIEVYLQDIIKQFKPDIVHIFGTEYAHTLAMTRIFKQKNRIVIGIQGVLSIYAQKYMADLPEQVIDSYTFRDWIKKDNIRDGQNSFYQRAKKEEEALNNVLHVLGRTKFDFDETLKINPNRIYHKLNETLREVFYKKHWELSKIERHTIFVSQGDYPIKGLHFMIQALPEIIKKYPDTKLYVAGNRVVPDFSVMGYIKRSSYGKYLQSLIRKHHLQKHIIFTGSLNEENMCKQFLKSNVFVSPSVIENSPNSVGEAMLLGMPVISSKVGGVPDLITNGEDGILVESANVAKFSKAIINVFENDDIVVKMGLKAHKKALQLHNREKNFYRLLEIYKEIEQG